MNKDSFRRWLKFIKKYEDGTINSRISNCERIETYYGDLEEIYSKDRFNNLLSDLTYSKKQFDNGINPKHKIPIDGNLYNGTSTLRSALNLYLQFKENDILKEIMVMPDIIPDQHDGSYELVRETVESLSKMSLDRIGIEDLDLLYSMAIGTWKGGIGFKVNRIEESNLPLEEKEKLKTVLKEVEQSARNHVYENSDKDTWSIGMFGTGFYTFKQKTDKPNAQRFISLCVKIKDLNDDDEILNIAGDVLNYGIKGMQAASASVVLHCLKPNTFPIINSAMIESSVLLEGKGIILNRPSLLTNYIENARKLKKFRDENCRFRNYRTLDIKLWDISKLEDMNEEDENFELQVREPANDEIRSNGDLNYWWLNANPKIWQFGNIKVGESVSYTSRNERGNKRRIYKNFEDVKKGEIVIGYEATPVKSIVALGHISQEHDGEMIQIQIDENLLEPIELSLLESIEGSNIMEPFANNLQGSLFKLTKTEYDKIMDIIRENNPTAPSTSNKHYGKEDFLDEVFMNEESYDSIVNLLNYKKNIILQGPPGVGKTFAAKRIAYSIMGEKDDSRIEMIQFHQSYTYEDFIMGYRPVDDGFKLKNGVFYKFCRRALNDPEKSYYFIIDEINRGNISKIFGEIMMLIEADKRGKSYAVPLTYTENKFYIPDNIYIIGTMNTADRSLAMLDYALRRRFCFIDMVPAFDDLNFKGYLENKNAELSPIIIDKLNRLNIDIENDISLGRGFLIGHSYFCLNKDIIDIKDYQDIINYEILPLLTEYWFDDLEKVREWKSELMEL